MARHRRPRCPKCRGEDIVRTGVRWRSAGGPLSFLEMPIEVHCRACGGVWKSVSESTLGLPLLQLTGCGCDKCQA